LKNKGLVLKFIQESKKNEKHKDLSFEIMIKPLKNAYLALLFGFL